MVSHEKTTAPLRLVKEREREREKEHTEDKKEGGRRLQSRDCTHTRTHIHTSVRKTTAISLIMLGEFGDQRKEIESNNFNDIHNL